MRAPSLQCTQASWCEQLVVCPSAPSCSGELAQGSVASSQPPMRSRRPRKPPLPLNELQTNLLWSGQPSQPALLINHNRDPAPVAGGEVPAPQSIDRGDSGPRHQSSTLAAARATTGHRRPEPSTRLRAAFPAIDVDVETVFGHVRPHAAPFGPLRTSLRALLGSKRAWKLSILAASSSGTTGSRERGNQAYQLSAFEIAFLCVTSSLRNTPCTVVSGLAFGRRWIHPCRCAGSVAPAILR